MLQILRSFDRKVYQHEGDESDEGHEGDEGHEVKDLRMALRAPLGSLYSSEIAMGGVCAGP